jgi:UDP-N-acetylmuramoyl-tripeptide--D-alanyl-D-alanine ligase
MSFQQYAPVDGREISNQACALSSPLTVAALVALVGAEPRLSGSGDAPVRRVCIDSRAAGADSVFVALKGERADGHRFLADVARGGCVAALVSREFIAGQPEGFTIEGLSLLVVPDPLCALQDWAADNLRRRPGLLRIGITGSNGKTTTKDLAAHVLSTAMAVFVSPGNLNSVIGLPLAALAVPASAEAAIFEMAMSEPGEMARLARIVFPAFAIVTNIGTAHIGNIGSRDGIAKEKKQIFAEFTGTETAIIPGSDDFTGFLGESLRGRVIRFGELHSAGYQGWEAWEQGQVIHWRGQAVHLRAAGRHLRSDALAVIALGEALGIAPEAIRRGLEGWHPAFGRNELLRGRVNLVLDCYNANPDSMAASLEAFAELDAAGGRRAVVLGDMRELGAHSAAAHAAIGETVARMDLDTVLFFGAEMERAWHAWQAARATGAGSARIRAEHHPDFPGLAAAAIRLIGDGDLVLLKASRGMELERLKPVLLGTPDNEGI